VELKISSIVLFLIYGCTYSKSEANSDTLMGIIDDTNEEIVEVNLDYEDGLL